MLQIQFHIERLKILNNTYFKVLLVIKKPFFFSKLGNPIIGFKKIQTAYKGKS